MSAGVPIIMLSVQCVVRLETRRLWTLYPPQSPVTGHSIPINRIKLRRRPLDRKSPWFGSQQEHRGTLPRKSTSCGGCLSLEAATGAPRLISCVMLFSRVQMPPANYADSMLYKVLRSCSAAPSLISTISLPKLVASGHTSSRNDVHAVWGRRKNGEACSPGKLASGSLCDNVARLIRSPVAAVNSR